MVVSFYPPRQCPACRDLQHDRFIPAGKFSGAPSPVNPSSRFLAIPILALYVSATAGCPNCSIIARGVGIFWKDCRAAGLPLLPESQPTFLVLESRPGKSLLVFEADQFMVSTAAGDIWRHYEFFQDEEAARGTAQDTVRNKAANAAQQMPSLFGPARCVPQRLTWENAARRLDGWLRCCTESHEKCREVLSPASSRMPERVLDISGDMLRLVEQPYPPSPYVTLSHCWGDPKHAELPPQTTHATLASRKEFILPSDLSPLFRDAIQLCRTVGYNYLWIDSLCIVQDDTADWAAQARAMAAIYENAQFNIAATGFHSGAESLFRDRSWVDDKGPRGHRGHTWHRYPVETHRVTTATNERGVPVFVRHSHVRDHRFVQEHAAYYRWHQAPLMTRAWVFQELLLARRVLHVCASELIWVCRSQQACECGSMDDTAGLDYFTIWFPQLQEPPTKQLLGQLRQDYNRGQVSARAVHDMWMRIVVQYSGMRLTRASDRAAALTGIATSIQPLLRGADYMAGMWLDDDLPRALMWMALSTVDRPNVESDLDRDDNGSTDADADAAQDDSSSSILMSTAAPSWSWMARRGRQRGNTVYTLYDDVLENGFQLHSASSIKPPRYPRGELSNKVSDRVLDNGIATTPMPSVLDHLALTFHGPVVSARAVVDVQIVPPLTDHIDIQFDDSSTCHGDEPADICPEYCVDCTYEDAAEEDGKRGFVCFLRPDCPAADADNLVNDAALECLVIGTDDVDRLYYAIVVRKAPETVECETVYQRVGAVILLVRSGAHNLVKQAPIETRLII